MSKRQSIRRGIITGMFLLFPITITWLSPALPVIYAMLGGVLTGAGIVLLSLFVSSLFLGRAFCGYACSAGGGQECLMRINEKKVKGTKINSIKYYIWAIWLIAIIVFFILSGGIKEVDFFAGTVDNWEFLIAPYRYVIYFGVLALFTTVNLSLGRRASCHTFCWIAPFMIIGTKLSDLLKLPRLRLKSNKDSCIGCKQCDKKCPMSLDVNIMVATGNMVNSECILCGECVDICSQKSITYSFSRKRS